VSKPAVRRATSGSKRLRGKRETTQWKYDKPNLRFALQMSRNQAKMIPL
jgi:hypothetical protein